MSRTLTEIYSQAKEKRDKYLELTEFHNSSKMSVLDAFTWVSSACIWVFENILDVFKIDLAKDLQYRINGTASYYANALLKYQSGDSLIMNEDGTQFSYPSEDQSKRIVTKVSCSEEQEEGFYDKKLILKIATGQPGAYERIDDAELLSIQAYLNQISFAGTHAEVVSRNGDILIPRLTVYYDGAVAPEEVYSNIENSLNEFVQNIPFDGVVYVQKIIDAIQKAEHVVDVYIDQENSQGIFVVQYDSDNNLINQNPDTSGDPYYEMPVTRSFVPNAGFVKQSSGSGAEADFQKWSESITLQIEGQEESE